MTPPKITKTEARTRHHLNRTLKKYRQHPTPGRQQAIQSYQQHLRTLEFWRTAHANPDMKITFRQLIEKGIIK